MEKDVLNYGGGDLCSTAVRKGGTGLLRHALSFLLTGAAKSECILDWNYNRSGFSQFTPFMPKEQE